MDEILQDYAVFGWPSARESAVQVRMEEICQISCQFGTILNLEESGYIHKETALIRSLKLYYVNSE